MGLTSQNFKKLWELNKTKMFNLSFVGFSLDVMGKVLVAFMALRVHHRVWQEHKIDSAVFKAMRKERVVGMVGIGLILAGYLLQVPGKLI